MKTLKGWFLIGLLSFGLAQAQVKTVFDFHDYKDVSVEDSGWLILKQDLKQPLVIPLNYTFCVHLYKGYSRLEYPGFVTINLLNDNGEKTFEFTTAAAWDGGVAITEFSQQVYSRPKTKVPFGTLEWFHVCVNVDFVSNIWKYYLDGKFVRDNNDVKTAAIFKQGGPRFNITENQKFELVLGTYRTRPPTMAHRMIGMLYGFNMYTQPMDHQTL